MTISLDAVITGAGIGGLAAALALRQAGHRVTVLEQATQFGEVGAGMQLVPNFTRALHYLGVLDRVALAAVAPTATVRRRWQDGRVLGTFGLGPAVQAQFGAPYWNAHRSDVHAVLLAAALDPARPGPVVQLQAGVRVAALDQQGPRPCLTDQQGRRWHADLVVGADGIHSVLRQALLGDDQPRFSGDDAYRALIDAADIAAVPDAAALVDAAQVNIWLGPDRHAIHYWVRDRRLLNLVVLVPGDGRTRESWSNAGDRQALLAHLHGWDPRLQALVGCARHVGRWSLYDREPLQRWSWPQVCLLGDACHPMLPYQSQGAAQALEDAVVLGRCLTGLSDPGQIPQALDRYQQRRLARASEIQAGSFANRAVFHLADGPQQRARDAALATQGSDFKAYEGAWADVC